MAVGRSALDGLTGPLPTQHGYGQTLTLLLGQQQVMPVFIQGSALPYADGGAVAVAGLLARAGTSHQSVQNANGLGGGSIMAVRIFGGGGTLQCGG